MPFPYLTALLEFLLDQIPMPNHGVPPSERLPTPFFPAGPVRLPVANPRVHMQFHMPCEIAFTLHEFAARGTAQLGPLVTDNVVAVSRDVWVLFATVRTSVWYPERKECE